VKAEDILAKLMEAGQDSIPLRYNRALAQLWLRHLSK